MKNKRYYLAACLGVLLVSAYPLYMGARVIFDMITDGTVLKEDYPKYIIPYTPICVAVLVGVVLMPVCIRLLRRFALLGGSILALSAFFALELLLENKVVVTDANAVAKLEDWQMFMCYVPPGGWPAHKVETPVEILMGNYDPAFKLHFYLISVVLILAVLNCLYGLAQMLRSGDRKRLKALVLQSVSTASFLGLCILACFTAFWRDGGLQVSPLSAVLMAAFFILMGMTMGIYVGSFLLGRPKGLSVWLSAGVAALGTGLMYLGESILLHGNFYRFGTGLLFAGLPGIGLAPVDILIILAAGLATAALFQGLDGKQKMVYYKDISKNEVAGMFDVLKVKEECVAWIRDFFEKNGPGCNAVVGISGGKDSSVAAALCVEALGKDRVIGVLMPQWEQHDIDMAKLLVEHLGIRHYVINVGPAVDALLGALPEGLEISAQTRQNLPPRIRMSTLYAVSQSCNGRVCNTCNLSEDWVGYSTRYGDSVGDFSPMSFLTVTEVKQIGRALGLPAVLVDKVPIDGLCGKTDEENLGFTYAELDRYIRQGIMDDPDKKALIDRKHRQNLFKLEFMPCFKPEI